MAAAALTAQAICRPNSRTCFSMQFNCKLNRGSVWQVPVSNLADNKSSEILARPLIFTSPSRGKFFVYASRNSDNKTSDDKLNLEENSNDVNNLEEKRDMQVNKKSELEELGEDFVGTVKPLIRVLNGSTSLMPSRKNALKPFLNAFVRTMSGSAWTASRKADFGKRFREVEASFLKARHSLEQINILIRHSNLPCSLLQGIQLQICKLQLTRLMEKYLLIVLSNGALLTIAFKISDGNSQLDTLIWCGWFAGLFTGTLIGANRVLEYRCKSGPQNVVITGSTRGLGKALAREFIFSGDHVIIASRSPDSVTRTVAQLQQELNEGIAISSANTTESQKRKGKVFGTSCDVSNAEDVKKLAEFAVSKLGSIDIWINNAGTNKGFRPLMQFTDEDINQIVSTNLIGSLICTREAIRVMKVQEKGGHIFNMDGAGSGGSSTPLTAVYGATKCGLRQLHTSLLKECKRSKVGIHTASPGMVLTDLLISGASVQNKKMFNIICELPETVARALVPRLRTVKGTGKAVNYLTPPRILLALITAWLRRDRWFDEKGKALYASETDRVRIWAENRARFSFDDAMDLYSDGSLVSVFSFSVVFAFIILSSSGSSMSGT